METSVTSEEEIDDDNDEEYDPWDNVIQKAFDQCQSQFENKVEKLMKVDNI